eukprot:TRINITY_DN3573_c0_g1_i1.p1 TRINITY_DN3573_c0_g1~~TRINITY_DN3573_c0_g1_i1.p1  ORF type:complete len:116 (+),score=22.39 TRINITY_DN3573_c0_g1_i1:57-404(+)
MSTKAATQPTFGEVLGKLSEKYNSLPTTLRLIDVYLIYTMLSGIVQFVYCALVGTFPFNSFLSGFISCVGCFTLGVCLRMQMNPDNKMGISKGRAFADFVFCHIILFLVSTNFMG